MTKINEYNPQTILHPYLTLAAKLEELGIGSKEFALRTGKPEKTISALLKGKSSITPDMAVQFENVLGIPAQFWLNKQSAYDEYIARKKRQEIIRKAIPWAEKFPVFDMYHKNWLPIIKSREEKAETLLSYFGFSNHKAWESFYCKKELKVAFRISLAHSKEPYAISAWLRKGELQATELEAPKYSEKRFKSCLHELKSLMVNNTDNFFPEMKKICLDSGVKVVHTPSLPKAPINGATRWLKNNPVIQLSNRYKRSDMFWFTFFHEAGHILLHGKKDIFIEIDSLRNQDKTKEDEANNFASNWLLKETEFQQIVSKDILTEDDVLCFAKKFNTHPAIIVGRLQHEHIIPYFKGRSIIEPVELP
jgi:HTH-type transcriptional regulator/antitoxin HigA